MQGRNTARLLALVALPILGGCVTASGGPAEHGIRPVLAIERSGAPAMAPIQASFTPGEFRVPQMKVIHVPPRQPRAPVTASRRPLPAAGGDLMLPLEDAILTSGFGMRAHPILGGERVHNGIDLAAPSGTPIFAAASGVVAAAGPNGGYGNFVRIRHAGGFSTAYGHMSRYGDGVTAGATVEQGQVIGYVGSTGLSTGPHLHWEVLYGNDAVDPFRIIGTEIRVALLRPSDLASANRR